MSAEFNQNLSQRYILLHSPSDDRHEQERSITPAGTLQMSVARAAGMALLVAGLAFAPVPLRAETGTATPAGTSAAPAASPEAKGETYVPQSGQPGKDVVWVPTPQALVDRMLDMAKVTPDDYLVDLGSGDGRTVITAAKRGLRAHGIEYNPDLVALSKRNAAEAGVADRATFEQADLFESDFSSAHVVTLFLLPSLNERLRPILLDMAPGTRVVSNSFDMGDWPPDETAQVAGCEQWCRALMWIVPAKVEGRWNVGDQELTLTQQYQRISGTLGGTPIADGRLNGREITFTAGGVTYTGTVDGDSMSGSSTGGQTSGWTATRS